MDHSTYPPQRVPTDHSYLHYISPGQYPSYQQYYQTPHERGDWQIRHCHNLPIKDDVNIPDDLQRYAKRKFPRVLSTLMYADIQTVRLRADGNMTIGCRSLNEVNKAERVNGSATMSLSRR